ncbi:MAG: Ig-like domain-containing protein [Clostridia bacterium]|nr:Ig-like domain-containing protein [Clostridia bacterium]
MSRKITFIFLLAVLFVVCFFCAFSETPAEVVIMEDALTIDLAESDTYQLDAYVLPEGADQSLNWYSSRNSTLSVKDGLLTAHRVGQVTITANIPKNGKIKDQLIVTIVDSRIPTAVTISGITELEPTSVTALTAEVEPEKASQEVIWESLNDHIAAVDQNGVVTAKRPGTVYIRAYAKDNRNIRSQIRLTVKYRKAPDAITLASDELSLFTGETCPLMPVVTPADASQILTFSSSDPSVATVDAQGVVSALQYGKCTITVKSAASASISVRVPLTVHDERIPDLLIAHPSSLKLEPSNIRDISLLVLPESMNAELVWSSNNENVAIVDQDGRVTALDEGECTIFLKSAYADSVSVKIPVTVKYGKPVKALTLSVSEITIPRGETASIIIEKQPADAGNALACVYSNPGICEMDEKGVIRALRRGESTVRIYSYRNPEIYGEFRVIVEDDLSPLSAQSDTNTKPVMKIGQTLSPSVSFLPENATQTYTWTCSNPEIAFVDESGVITAVSPGVSKICAVNSHANEIFVEFTVTVEPDEYTLIMPERRTEIDALEDNMQKIENVRLSAQKMLLKDYEEGLIGIKEYKKRKEVIDAAFEMYAFPWMTQRVQKYWNDAYSEGGMKDFKPGIVYYGLPYVSGGNSNRTYDVRRALEQGRYLPASDGDYYIFNHNHEFYDGMYVGSDCSSFVSLAYFGNAMHNGDIVKTYTLYYDERFTTTDDPENLRAGDLLVRHSIHVLIFLYWADDAHTQAVFIEQGGSEPGINTCSTSVYTVSDYMNNHYHIRSPFYR